MLRFLDLEGAYAAADKAVGGWLPGGGTANPLSDAVRPALETINPSDPSVSNYYRENRDTAREQGQEALRQSSEIKRDLATRANDAALAGGPNATTEWRMQAYDSAYRSEEGQEQRAQINELTTRARRHGVGPYQDLLPDASDREAVLYNRGNADLNAAQIESLTTRTLYGGANPDIERQRIVEEEKTANTRIDKAESGANLAETINNSFGLDTRDGPDNGGLSCVYGVNKVIEAAGLEVPWKDPASGANSVYIPFVEGWITSNGGSIVSNEEAQSGDIVSNGGHMGILTDEVDVSGNKIVLSNSSSKGSMTFKYPLGENGGNKVYRVPQLQI